MNQKFLYKILIIAITPSIIIYLSIFLLDQKIYSDIHQIIFQRYTDNMHANYKNHLQIKGKDLKLIIESRINSIKSELKIIAGSAQKIIDNPSLNKLGSSLQSYAFFKNDFIYNDSYDYLSSTKNPSNSALSIWGYLQKGGKIHDDTQHEVLKINPLKYILGSVSDHGIDKSWAYYLGPKETPFMLSSPWENMAEKFQQNYPGHNSYNLWDYFFPGMIEGWDKWLQDPKLISTVSDHQITQSPLYKDAAGKGLMVTFFHPLWDSKRTRNLGAVAVDYEIGHLISLVDDEEIDHDGFALLVQSDGSIIDYDQSNNHILQIESTTTKSEGVEKTSYNLNNSHHVELRTVANSLNGSEEHNQLTVDNKNYLVNIQKIFDFNLWNGGEIISNDSLYVALIISEEKISEEIDSLLGDIDLTIENQHQVQLLVSSVILSLVIFLATYFSIRFTKQIRLMNIGIKRVRSGKPNRKVKVIDNGELGELALAFNYMIVEINKHNKEMDTYAKTLENKVYERTKQLADKNKELEKLAVTDSLTHSYNRNMLNKILTKANKNYSRHGSSFGIVIIDVDNFKAINDSLGHDIGDSVLIELTNIINSEKRATDTFGRWGGDEFFYIIENTTKNEVVFVAEKLNNAVKSFKFNNIEKVTVSIGAALIKDGDTLSSLTKRADDALYQAKGSGRNKVCFID